MAVESNQKRRKLIITGASESYAPQLLALIGSANCNWRNHPPIVVYDLGLEDSTLKILDKACIEVRKVPHFVNHWRQHFTWKIWCINDAPCDEYLWLDAGVCILRPIPEAFEFTWNLGYFVQPNGFTLEHSVCTPLREYFHVTSENLADILSINAGIHGFHKSHAKALLTEAMALCREEQYMKAMKPLDRHDQDLLTLLLYKYFSPVLFASYMLYAQSIGPKTCNLQRVWVHRRGRMLHSDLKYFHQAVMNRSLPPHLPSGFHDPAKKSIMMRLRILLAKLRGRYPNNVRKNCPYDGVRN